MSIVPLQTPKPIAPNLYMNLDALECPEQELAEISTIEPFQLTNIAQIPDFFINKSERLLVRKQLLRCRKRHCKDNFQTFSVKELWHHLKTSHAGDYLCQSCNHVFSGLSLIRRHYQICVVGYKCAGCHKSFNKKSNLTRHHRSCQPYLLKTKQVYMMKSSLENIQAGLTGSSSATALTSNSLTGLSSALGSAAPNVTRPLTCTNNSMGNNILSKLTSPSSTTISLQNMNWNPLAANKLVSPLATTPTLQNLGNTFKNLPLMKVTGPSNVNQISHLPAVTLSSALANLQNSLKQNYGNIGRGSNLNTMNAQLESMKLQLNLNELQKNQVNNFKTLQPPNQSQGHPVNLTNIPPLPQMPQISPLSTTASVTPNLSTIPNPSLQSSIQSELLIKILPELNSKQGSKTLSSDLIQAIKNNISSPAEVSNNVVADNGNKGLLTLNEKVKNSSKSPFMMNEILGFGLLVLNALMHFLKSTCKKLSIHSSTPIRTKLPP